MTWSKRIAPIAVAATIGIGGVAVPALGASSTTHWSTAKCTAYKTSFHKRHGHPTKAQKAAANKVLKRHGCTARV